ncbi:DNA ligase 6 isoform X1 [Elaeis guineensis]|uniref:DNA ligase n=1 Tax=Elaeis guineensis var. tenera TaxID=51953 RepID=A0A8N4IH41_ELAGV|nr:DNA ligase 6 isoform X2 [Elaeis guineensis]XP_029121739.1 DNA ligase 6 isoform X2 [Elaeis guineensis]
MATLSSSTTKTRTLTSSSVFLDSYRSSSNLSAPTAPSLAFDLLSRGSPLPPIPPDFPHSKLIPSTRFIVDGFRSAGDFSVSYFLSHFHSDHYAGLSPSWSKGLIICSETTARLVVEILNVLPFFVVSLSLGETAEIDGWDVTAVDANHCPGAVQFLFKAHGSEGHRPERYVHTGDFRFCDSMKLDPTLCEFIGADAVFLDTTYCNPKYTFPSQEESVEYVVSTIKRIRDQNKGPRETILFLIATYVVGKEKILLEISRRCDCLLHVDSRKMGILSVLGFGDSGVFTEDISASNIHVIGWNLLGETWPYFRPNFVKMKELMTERGYSKAVGFVSTGWMYETKKDGFAVRIKESLEIHLVPYSEHSNYHELREYVRFLRPKRVIPTVGMDVEKLDGKHAIALQKHFAGLVDETANKHEFLMAFHQKLGDADTMAGNDVVTNTSKQDSAEGKENSYLEPLQSGERSHLQDPNMSNDEDMAEVINELKDCLPSWVTQNQILGLLKSSDGDIVGAASHFFEHETEFYEQAKVVTASVPRNQNSCTEIESFPAQKSIQGHSTCDLKDYLDNAKTPTRQKPTSLSSNLPKKRGAGTGNKPSKKGKSSSGLESSGCKQTTITKFFGRLEAHASYGDGPCTVTADYHLENGNQTLTDADETYKNELDLFLQIIDGGMQRDSAALLLEKTKGNIDVAVDMYFSGSKLVSGTKESLFSCSAHVDKDESLASGCTSKANISFEATINLPTLFVQGSSAEDTTVTNVSLPIEKYSPVEYACWKAGQPAPYLHLARTFDLVEREKGKIKTTVMLCNMFRSLLSLSPDDVLPAVYLCTNRIAPDHENMELNIGGSLVITALEEACGTSRSRIKEMYKTSGDFGDVAQECRQTQSLLAPPCPLSIHNLFYVLRKISVTTGAGSAVQRKNLVVNLMRSCREMEIKFLVRTLVRNLRIGAMMKTILPALAQAVVLNSYTPMQDIGSVGSQKLQLQGISAAVTEAYNILPNLDLLIPSLLSKGIDFSASTLTMVPGTPIHPMLARITNGVSQVLKLFQGRSFTCEYKYDGQRAQIHKLADGSIRVFSRQMKESTSRFPDLIHIIKEMYKPEISTFILDAEVVAVDRKNGCKLMSFQELSSRERGSKDSSITMNSIKVDICIFIFDIMFSNGERLLEYPLRQRRKCIKDLFHNEKMGYLEFAREITVEAEEAFLSNQNTLTKINSFFEDACTSSCEGIMVKTLDVDAGYFASKRSEAWLKVKRDYVEGLGDCLDLVPIGAWHGNGRKAGWYSPCLMACYNPDAEEFQSVCRVMSGFSDSFYKEMKEYFSGEKILSKKPPYYQTDDSPDLWFPPELVWEIRGADLTISPVHHAAVGLVHPSRGISVRLPRLEGWR